MALIHRYRFENNGNDAVGSADGYLESGAVYTSSQKVEGSYGLSTDTGGDDSFQTGSFTLADEFTVAVWIRNWGAYSGTRALITNYDSTDGIQINWNYSTSKIEVLTGNGTSTATAYSNTLSYSSGGLYQIAVTCDRSTGTCKIYLNGTDVTSSDNDIRTDFELTHAWRVGLNFNNSGDSWSYFDDFQIYSGVLSATDVSDLYNTPGSIINTTIGDLDGDISANSSTTGDLKGTGELDGDIDGTTTLTGVISGSGSLYGWSPDDEMVILGTAKGSGELKGDINGVSDTSGIVKGYCSLDGDSISSSSTSGTVYAYGSINGISFGSSITAGTLSGAGSMAGAVSGLATSVATLLASGKLSGDISGMASTSGELGMKPSLEGGIIANSFVQGTVRGVGEISAHITGTSSISGQIVATGVLTGSLDGIGTVSGTMTVSAQTKWLEGPVVGNATVVANISGAGVLGGSINGASTSEGRLLGAAAFSGAINGSTTLNGRLWNAAGKRYITGHSHPDYSETIYIYIEKVVEASVETQKLTGEVFNAEITGAIETIEINGEMLQDINSGDISTNEITGTI